MNNNYISKQKELFTESFFEGMQPLLEIADKERPLDTWNEKVTEAHLKVIHLFESSMKLAEREGYKRGVKAAQMIVVRYERIEDMETALTTLLTKQEEK